MKKKGSNDLAMVYIMEILSSDTDQYKTMLFQEVEETLREDYCIDLDRRTVASKINLLIEEGLIKRKGRKGGVYYDNRPFKDEELELLIYSVIANRNLPPARARNLAYRIGYLGGQHFISRIKTGRNMLTEMRSEDRSVDGKDYRELLSDLDVINQAIDKKKQITFDSCRYRMDKTLQTDSSHTASPYYVMMKDQKLWLIAYSETQGAVSFFRIDRIKNVCILNKKAVDIKTIHGYELGLDTEYLRSSLPYMFSDRPERITFRADEEVVDNIVDWFGRSVTLKRDREDSSKVIATLRTSPAAIEHWAKQYLDHVEIIEPLSLRERIRESLENGAIKYSAADK